MAKTPNLGLTLTGTSESDSNQTFLNWRTDMSGVGPGSNMQLIDAAYGNLRQAQEDAADDIADLKDAVDDLSALSDDVDDISQPYNLVTTHSRATFFVDPNNAYIQVDDSSPGEYNIWVARVEPGKTYAVLTDESPITYLLWMVSPIEVLGEDEIGIGNPLMDGATLLTSGSNIITIPNNVNNKFIAFRSSNEFTNGMVAECFAEPGYGTAETKTANDVMARAETKALKQEVADTKDVVMSAFVANTVSGTAISFDDGADDVPVGSFIIDIEATQSGSGDPSPDNVRTIVGRTSTTVTQHGKNLANVVDNTYTSSGVTFTSANGAVRMSGTSTGTINRTIGTVQLLAGVKYIISGTKSSGIADSDTLRIDLRTSSGSVIASGNSYDGFAYTPNEDIIAQVNIRFVSGQTINATVYPQVEAGETATDFEPYVMISRTIDWSDVAGPIFHGTLDVLTGQLTVDRILFQTTWGAGTIQNTKNDIITKVFSLPMSYSIATGAPASSKCNVCTYKVSMSAYTESAFQFVMKQESGAYRWKLVMGLPSSTLDDQAIQVAYLVDAPVIYHLAPTEVRTLLGTNIISASSDNITLKYCASPSSIKNAIEDLVKVQATQPVEPDNKIWFDTDIDDEYTVPDYAEFTEVKGDVEDLKSHVAKLATDYQSKNLYDYTKCVSGYLNATTGAITENSGRKVSDYMPVVPGKYLTLSRMLSSQAAYSAPSICYFNANKEAVAGGATWKSALIVPSGAVYVRVCIEANVGASLQVELTSDGVFTSFALYYAPYTGLNEDVVVPLCQDIKSTVDSLVSDITKTVVYDYYSTYVGNFTPGYIDRDGITYESTTYSYSNKIPVKPGYVLKGITTDHTQAIPFRYVVAYSGDTVVSSAGNASDQPMYIVPDGIDGVVVSVRYYKGNRSVEIYGENGAAKYIVPQNPIGYMRASGDMSDGTILHVAENNVKNKVVVAFSGNITTFDTLYVGQRNASNSDMLSCYVEINDTNVIVHTDQGNVTAAHGLTIANDIQVQVETENAVATSRIRIVSSGEVYEDTTPHRWLCDSGFASAVSVGSELTDCALSWTSRNITKPIWIFGDSYISLYPQRWVYYLINDGFADNCIINGYAGENSKMGKVSLDNLIALTKPKYVVWLMGMNDADSDSAVNSDWYDCYKYVVSICKQYDITPIFATIPNVPTVNNTFKNAIVRASGYRYIDFSKALDPDEDGDWITGALSLDGVHPSEIGAKISYQRVLVDFPEIVTL